MTRLIAPTATTATTPTARSVHESGPLIVSASRNVVEVVWRLVRIGHLHTVSTSAWFDGTARALGLRTLEDNR